MPVATVIITEKPLPLAVKYENEPSAALAVTKRDFVDPARLGEWLRANNIAAPANLRSYGAPHFWVPFVLTIGTMDAPN